MELNVWHVWTLAGIALLVVEIFTAGFIVGIFGLACFAGAVAALFGFGSNPQLLAFAIATVLFAFTVRPFMLRYASSRDAESKSNVEALIGREGRVSSAIDPVTNAGQVKVGGEEWKARAVDAGAIEAGSTVTVSSVEGCTLVVEHKAR